MVQLSGRIIVAESGKGIPNLLVEAWHRTDGGSGAESVFGSALTDPHGQFSIGYSLRGKDGNNPVRPDLALRIFAPARGKSAMDSDGVPQEMLLLYASPPQKRGAAPAGTSIVQLSRELLQRYEVPENLASLAQRDPMVRASHLGERLEQAQAARDELAEKLRGLRDPESTRIAKRRANAEAWAAAIVLKPRGASQPPPIRPDREGIEKLHRVARRDGLARFKTMTVSALVTADAKTRRALGLASSGAAITGTLAPSVATDLIFRGSGERDLIRRDHTLSPLSAQQRLAKIEASARDKDVSREPPTIDLTGDGGDHG